MTVTGTANVSGTVNAGNVSTTNVTASSLTSGRVTLAGTGGKLEDSTNLTFNGSLLSVTGTANVSGTVNTSNVTVSSLIGGRVTFAELSTNRLVDSANLTFDGTILTVPTANVTTVNSGTITNTGDITSGNVYANSGTVKATYLEGTLTTAAQPNITSTGTLTSLTVSGTTNLGAIGNVTITGGTSGQVLVTNGAGVLSFATNDTSRIVNGTSNVSIPTANGNVNMVVGGSTIVEVSGTGANVTGVVNVTGNISGDNIAVANVLTANANVDSTSSVTGTIKVTGGIGATGNIYTGHSVGFANNNGGTASKAYIQFNETANSLDFIFN